MRKLLMLPVLAVAVACGGGSDLFSSGEGYPTTKSLALEFRNNSTGAADIWLEPEVKGVGTNVAAGATRTATRSETWSESSDVHTFKFHAFKPGLLSDAAAQLTIDGHEAHAENFSGFIATWDGTTLRVSTK